MTARPEWEIEGRDWPNRAHSRFVEAGRLRWHVQTLGAGPALLLLHGTGAATHSWRDLAPLLAEDFTVVAPDLPGHGFTTGRPAGGLAMPAMASAVGDLLAALAVEPQLIVGHSAGAAIALRMALDRPHPSALRASSLSRREREGAAQPRKSEDELRGIVGLNPALLPFPGLGARLFPTLARMLFVNPFAPHIFARIAQTPGEVGRFLKRSTGSEIDTAGVDCYRRLFATPGHCSGAITMMADWNLEVLRRDLPRADVPVLLIHGEADIAIPPAKSDEAAAILPNATVERINGGHLAHEEQPAEVAAIIRRFCGEVR